jgi:predicted deacylase
MQRINFALLVLCAGVLATTATAQERDRYHVPRAARETLIRMKSTVHHGSAGGYYTADLTPAEVETLCQAGFEAVPAPAKPPEAGGGQAMGSLSGWTPYAQMRSDFRAYAETYPDIAEFHVIGQSVQGRDIFALRISDNVAVEEDEPEVVIWANIHGDEQASGEIAYRWAMELLDAYGVDPTLTGYVDDLEIWVIPLLNPDGHENGTRENFNGVDLNRDFGWNWEPGWGSSLAPYSQLETRSLQEFCLKENVSLSATLHCDGDIVLYPWCYSPNDVPEHDLVTYVGFLYANAANYTLIKSWDDYETHGELLDLIHGGYGSLCYTAEISLDLQLFDESYARNKAGIELFCRKAGTGLHGLVTDAQTGQPLRAMVTVSGSPYPAYTDPSLGDVHRLAYPGTYDVTVWANGYEPQTVSGLQVALGAATDFAVALQPGGQKHAFFVTSVNQSDPNDTFNNVTPAAYALGAPDGLACSLGSTGFIVLDMGAGNDIADGPGDDFTVTEAIVPGDHQQEPYSVFAGDAYDQDVLIGSGRGTASFDLAGSGVGTTRWLRIVSNSNQDVDGPLAGLELDGVTILHSIGSKFFSAFCAGDGLDPQVTTPCPCANSGAAGHGCDNSIATGGALLSAAGTTSPDTVVLTSSGELPNAFSIFLQGDASVPTGLSFGDGVRCVAGSLKRLYEKNASGGVVSAPASGDPSITARSASLGDPIAPGSTRYYQTYYRDPNLAFCPPSAGDAWNVGSGLKIVW